MKILGPILLVEDSPEDVELTLDALQEGGVANEIAIARDGAEALDWLTRRGVHATRTDEHPVVVLLDLKLPKLSGVDVLRAVKADAQLRAIPVVVLTSSREAPDVEECYALGANAYVVKPVVFEDFRAAVRNLGVFWAAVNEPPPRS